MDCKIISRTPSHARPPGPRQQVCIRIDGGLANLSRHSKSWAGCRTSIALPARALPVREGVKIAEVEFSADGSQTNTFLTINRREIGRAVLLCTGGVFAASY